MVNIDFRTVFVECFAKGGGGAAGATTKLTEEGGPWPVCTAETEFKVWKLQGRAAPFQNLGEKYSHW